MAVSGSEWSLRELFWHQEDKTLQITGVSQGECFCIQILPCNFYQSPNSLERYNRFMNSLCNEEEDFETAKMAQEGLLQWAVNPFLPILKQLELSSGMEQDRRHYTLQDWFTPKTYRFQLYVVDDQKEPRFDYEVQDEPLPSGVCLNGNDFNFHPSWQIFKPSDVSIYDTDSEERFARFPYKVVAGGNLCFYKPLLDDDDKRKAIREMDIYKRMENSDLFCNQVQVPRLYGVVMQEYRLLGLLLSFINCEYRTLECAVGHRTSAVRLKWGEQVSSTLARLHGAGIVWGDAKAANVLVDEDDNAWIIDFGGGYTQGWVKKEHMETIEGDREGLEKIKELLSLKVAAL